MLLLKTRRFTVDEYYRMAEVGILGEDDRVELLKGEIVEMSPIGKEHAACVDRLNRLLNRLCGDGAQVRIQNPVRLDRFGEPQPDVALLRPRADFYARGHPEPADVFLLVEVADTSVGYDRDVKTPQYAAAGIPEVWIVNLVGDAVEVHREPAADSYRDVRKLGRAETLTIAALPGVEVRVEEVLGAR